MLGVSDLDMEHEGELRFCPKGVACHPPMMLEQR